MTDANNHPIDENNPPAMQTNPRQSSVASQGRLRSLPISQYNNNVFDPKSFLTADEEWAAWTQCNPDFDNDNADQWASLNDSYPQYGEQLDPTFYNGTVDFSGLGATMDEDARRWSISQLINPSLIALPTVAPLAPDPQPQATYPPQDILAHAPMPYPTNIDPAILRNDAQPEPERRITELSGTETDLPQHQDEETQALVRVDVASDRSLSRKRTRTDSQNSDEDADRRHKKTRTSSVESTSASSRSRGTSWSSVSDHSARKLLRKTRLIQHRASAVAHHRPQKPKTDDDHPWVRINTTTQGLTTRTAKINNYTTFYEERGHPLGDWHSTHYHFKYTPAGEFKEKTMSAAQIKEFILEYPKGKKGARLKLWIQKGPTDSARRYKSNTWAKCRFRDCPAHIYQTGTILHGHYRVAFDEKWHRDRENADPFLTAGYVHLYCMERFLDFPEICRHADVEVDTRTLTNEPNGKFAATLAAQPECGIAQDFVAHAQQRKVRKIDVFENYPRHNEKAVRGGVTLYHENTLTYHMSFNKARSRPPAQIRQFKARGLKDSHLLVNLGDLEILFREIRNRRKAKKQAKGKKRKAYDSEDEDDSDNEGKLGLVKKAEERFGLKDRKRSKRSLKPKKQKQVDLDSDDEDSHYSAASDDESDDGIDWHGRRPHTPSLRSSERIKQQAKQPNYQLDTADDGLFVSEQPYNSNDPDLVNAAHRHSLDLNQLLNEPLDTDLTQDQIDALLNAGLSRRHSSIASILKNTPGSSRRNSSRARRVSMMGPVTTYEFDKSMPPHSQPQRGRRYSTRSQNKAASTLEPGRVNKRRSV